MLRRALFGLIVLLSVVMPAAAQKAKKDALPAPRMGPATIKLNDSVTLALPPGYGYYDASTTVDLMRKAGNPRNANCVGMIMKPQQTWFILIDYTQPGHISDGDAADLNADNLLQNFQKGTEAANEERRKMGVEPLELKGWAEKPRYEATGHRLLWALLGHTSRGDVVNCFIRVLGKEGLVSLNLVCDPSELASNRSSLETMVAGVTFNPGLAYSDFQEGRDKDSGMSLTSVILGGGAAAAAAKMGIFGKLGHFLLAIILALKKLVIVVVAAIGAGIQKIVNRKKDGGAMAAQAVSPEVTPGETPTQVG